MTAKKVYCSNCIYLSDESAVVAPRHYHNIRFRNEPDKRINNGVDICISGMEKKTIEVYSPIHREIKLTVTVDNPFIRNMNNDCIMYKEKLYPKIISWIKKYSNKIRG
jgi:hypothetical protein